MSFKFTYRRLIIGLALWSNCLVAEKIQYLDQESENSKNIRLYVSSYFDALSKHDVSEFSYLSENFHSRWRQRVRESVRNLTKSGFITEDETFFVIIEGFGIKKGEANALEHYMDIIYLNKIEGGYQINEKASYPEFERVKKVNFQKTSRTVFDGDIEALLKEGDIMWYRMTSRPSGMPEEEWEEVWKEHFLKVQERRRENEALNNIVFNSFEDLAQRYKVSYYEDVTFFIFDNPIQNRSTLENAVKSYLFYNLLLFRKKYYESWNWDRKTVESGKGFAEKNYTPEILSYANISLSGILKCVLHFSIEIPFKDEKYAVVFTTFHPHRENEFMAIKSEHAMDTKFIGVAFMAFRMNNGIWEMTNNLDGFRGLGRIMINLKINGLNFTATVFQNKIEEYLDGALLPDQAKENILNVD